MIAYRLHEISIQRSPATAEPIFVNDTEQLVGAVRSYYTDTDREMMLALVLDDINKLLGIYEVARGGSREVQADPANILRPAVLLGGAKVLLVHNHPTGDLEASDADVRSAKLIVVAASLLGMDISDNIILNTDTLATSSVHDHPEYVRWATEDLGKIAELVIGEKLEVEVE